MTTIALPVSAGDFLDRLTILQIKSERIGDTQKNQIVQTQLTQYLAILDQSLPPLSAQAQDQLAALKATNMALWDVEDDLRQCEAKGQFDADFVALARSVYQLNDKRAAQKYALDMMFGAIPGEVKDFTSP